MGTVSKRVVAPSMLRLSFALFSLLPTLIFCKGNNSKDGLAKKAACDDLKPIVQEAFDKENYKKTILLLEQFKPCFPDQAVYYQKLGLLYAADHDLGQSEKTFDQYLIIRKKQGLAGNGYLMEQANIYCILGKREELIDILSRINKGALNSEQEEIYVYCLMIATQGEFISSEMKVDFELFD